MIFDSEEMKKLRKKYLHDRDYRVPEIVYLDRSKEYCEERKFLEDIFLSIPEDKRNQVLGRFLSIKDSQHLGAWFELMVNGWLNEFTSVMPEPSIEGNDPDFLIDLEDQKIVIECRVHAINPKTRLYNQWETEIMMELREVKLSFGVIIEVCELNSLPNIRELVKIVEKWLTKKPEKMLIFEDVMGNVIEFNAIKMESLSNVEISISSGFSLISSDPIKSPLKEKAKQHKSVRKSGYPYVIAIYLEDGKLDANDVKEALFGKPQYLINFDSKEIVGVKSDLKGVFYYANSIVNKSVSGILIFKSKIDSKTKRRNLFGWYFENPYAKVAIDQNYFPTESSYIVKEKTEESYQMTWKKNER